jgi:dTDP-4-dehydrorhamnose 3,5-epimerase
MIFTELQLSGVFTVSPQRHDDERGFFSESFREDKFSAAIEQSPNFVQDNVVLSGSKNTIRGLHFQAPPHAQGKLVSCLSGCVIDIIVDIRKNSQTYGEHLSVELSSETGQQIWVPPGFAHGYITQEPNSLVMYKVTDYYAPDCEGTILWNDPGLAIDWGINPTDAILSEKDKAAQSFASFQTPFK